MWYRVISGKTSADLLLIVPLGKINETLVKVQNCSPLFYENFGLFTDTALLMLITFLSVHKVLPQTCSQTRSFDACF